MSFWFAILTVLFIGVSVAMVLIILVQRPQGGGLAGAFGGASGGGTDSAFGGRTGDALTAATVGAFVVYLVLALGLNILDHRHLAGPSVTATPTGSGATPADGSTTEGSTDGTAPTGSAATGDAPTGSTGTTGSSGSGSDAGSTGSTGSADASGDGKPATTPPPTTPASEPANK